MLPSTSLLIDINLKKKKRIIQETGGRDVVQKQNDCLAWGWQGKNGRGVGEEKEKKKRR